MKVHLPSFTINIVSKPKKIKSTGTQISRKCYARVVLIDGKYKAAINYKQDDIENIKSYIADNQCIILSFTDKSLDLKDKLYVFLKKKDKYNHDICIIRDIDKAHLHPGWDKQYDAVRENLLLAGHIVRKDGKLLFEYEDLISFHYNSGYYINTVKIDTDKPLFNK